MSSILNRPCALSQIVAALFVVVLSVSPADGQHADAGAELPVPSPPEVSLQESVNLYRVTSAVLPVDGLLRVGAGGRLYGTVYLIDGVLHQIDLRDYLLELEYGILPAWHLRASIPYRQWSGGLGFVPATGSGWGDGSVDAVFGLPRPASFMSWAVDVGTSLPTGVAAAGLSEEKYSPHLKFAATLQFWEHSQLPEMRLHLNGGYRWNSAESGGFGADGAAGFQPWPPRYPPVAAGGKNADNDFVLWGAALEFRQGLTSLFVEYSEARLPWSSALTGRENQRFVTAGMTWGRAEGLALRTAYDVSLAREDPATPFTAAYPDLVYYAAVSWQIPVAGRDADRDGVPDRRDRCRTTPEDRDGFADEDGCPDPDNDGDGILDVWDGAPNEPEDPDGFEDQDGIPDPDNDGDGVPDVRDLCPNEAEDLDGYRDEDGCPEAFLDQDLDGISDDEDRCPGRPEDMDGFEDDDGCPEVDNDLDGIEDRRDRCPDEAEDYNGIDDDDGCPDGTTDDDGASSSN